MSDLSTARYLKTSRRNRWVEFSHMYEGFTLTGWAEIDPGAPDTWDEPGWGPDVVGMRDLCIDGKPAADLLNPKVEHWLYEQILEKENGR